MAKFDPEIVLEFYANAWTTEEGVRDMRSWVRGQWIPFDEDALSQFLGDPLVLEERQQCEFSQRRNRADGFNEEAIAQLLCTPGQDFARTAAGRRVRIMRTSMTTLTQTWMTLLLNNVLPSDHNSDLPLPKCQLVYAILTRMSVHVAQVIADAIYLFAGMASPEPSSRSTARLGRCSRVTHIRPQVHRHHLGRSILLGHWAWSAIYSIWFASRRPTTVGRCRYMSVSTGSASVSRGRVSPLLYALPQSSLGLRSLGLETGPMPK